MLWLLLFAGCDEETPDTTFSCSCEAYDDANGDGTADDADGDGSAEVVANGYGVCVCSCTDTSNAC